MQHVPVLHRFCVRLQPTDRENQNRIVFETAQFDYAMFVEFKKKKKQKKNHKICCILFDDVGANEETKTHKTNKKNSKQLTAWNWSKH